MATTTENYGLKKPLETDYYDIEIQNENMDRIDMVIKEVEAYVGELNLQNLKLSGEQILTGVKFFPTLISNSESNHLQFFRNFAKEWHVEALADKLSVVQSGTAERVSIGKDGTVSINGYLNISTPTLSSHASNKQYVDDNRYVHPNTGGNKHIPAGGAANQVLQYGGSSGTATWQNLEASEMSLSAATAMLIGVNNVDAAIAKLYSIPVGAIIMWGGSITSIPSGWVLCNGSNGTPDLRNRFVVGAGNTYTVGAIGGNNEQSILAHEHTYSGNTDNNSSKKNVVTGSSVTSEVPTPTHRHSYSGTTDMGGGATIDNRPPYYALAYIMRVS